MDLLDGLVSGFEVAVSPINLLFVFVGVCLGMLVGVLPGLGPSATIALLLPITFTMDAATAIIMLAGVYYGAMYGGTITSVLLRLPGEAASVVTTYDGYQMARQGNAGKALGLAAIGSFVGGLLATLTLATIAPTLASFALRFGPAEFATLAVLGLLLVAYSTSDSILKALLGIGIGLTLATVGQDPISAVPRFDFGLTSLAAGLDEVAIIMGLFGLSEVLSNLENTRAGVLISRQIGKVLPSLRDLRSNVGAIIRGSVIGTAIGLIPGGGGVLASLSSYATERRLSKAPHTFGKGAPRGVSGPETANNSASVSAFIPLLTLGLPPNGVLAVIFGALLIQGVTPGPMLITDHPEVFWGVIASMFIGNLILVFLNIPLVRLFVRITQVPPALLSTVAVVVMLVGAYSINNTTFDIAVMIAAGVIGYLLRKLGIHPGPIVLAFILGSILEEAARQTLIISGGNVLVFFKRPISGILITLITVVSIAIVGRAIRKRYGRSGRARTGAVEADLGAVNGGHSPVEENSAAREEPVDYDAGSELEGRTRVDVESRNT